MQDYSIGWSSFLLYTLLVIGLYFLLLLLVGVLNRAQFLGVWQTRLNRLLQFILQAYEPLALVIVLVAFILVNPVVHGLIALFFMILGYQPIRNYISGRIFLMANDLKEGQHIGFPGGTGVVKGMERLGMILQTPEGLRFVNYSFLLSNGFTLLKGEKVGGLVKLLLRPEQEEEKNHSSVLHNRLFSCPYIDWTFRPEIKMPNGTEKEISVKILVREDQHLNHLIRLMEEWGYQCMVAS